ncbi:MAG: ABC transporter substrate-binding protein [Anaerolineae bacterium]|nr:ABC transporter substrate-binding protein [Anaerolineae bacterium]
MKRSLIFLLAIAVVLLACTSQATQETAPTMTQINLPMGYIADPQYAPFYVAKEKGYFAEEGIDLSFDYSFETDGMALVGANQRPFAIVGGDQVILARAQDLPVVYIFEWFQRFPIAVISKSDANIKTPQDLVGHSIGLPGFFGASYVGYLGILSAAGLQPEDVNTSEIGFTQVESLLTDKVEVIVGYINNEPVQLTSMGESVNVIDVADYIDMVGNGLITNETIIKENPALVEGFVRATLRGLKDTLADPAAAFEISKKYVEGMDDDRYPVLQASLPIWQTDRLGITSADSWQQTHDILLNNGLLDAPVPNLEAAFTNTFVEKVQP